MSRNVVALWAVAWLALAAPFAASAEDLSFTSGIDVAADCNDVWENLTEFAKLQKLVPHLHGTANIARATKLGDALFYELETTEGKKNTGKFVVTSLEPAYKLQVIVQPDEGPWLRVQEFTLLTPPPAKEKKDGERCRVDYEESFNQLALKHKGYDTSGFVRDLREPYMGTILRRLKNLSEGKDAGPKDEVTKLREVAKNFP